MKNILLFLIFFFLPMSFIHATDTPPKIGLVNLEFIMSSLPDAKKIKSDLNIFQNNIQKQLQTKLKQIQDKLQELKQAPATISDTLKSQKQAEFQQLYSDLERFQKESQESLVNKQLKLIKPIYQKVLKTIQEVAKENQFTHVLNANTGGISIVLYAQPEYNISNLVLKKLGIDPLQAAKTAIEQTTKKIQESKPESDKKGETPKPQNKNKN